MPDLNAIFVWLDLIALAKKLNEEIDSWPKPELALGVKAKKDRLAMLSFEMFEIERQEEAIVEQSENEGPALQRRPEVDPHAIFGIPQRPIDLRA